MGLFKKKLSFTIIVVIESDDGRFHAFCPSLKGLHVEGTTEEEACQNAIDAAIAYLKSLIKHGDPIPLGVMVKEEEEQNLPQMSTPSKRIRQIPVYV